MDRRRQSRLATDVMGTYSHPGGQPQDAYVSQISVNGCRLVERVPCLLEGDRIEVTIGAIGPFEGIVRWTCDNLAGVEFKVSLHPAVVEHFAAYCRQAG